MGADEDIRAVEDLVRRAYEAFAARDIERLRGLAAPEVEVSTVTGLVAGREGPYVGLEGIRRYLDDVAATWDEIELVPQRFDRVDEERVLVLGRVRARRGSNLIDAPTVWLWTVRDGRIVSARVFSDPQDAMEMLRETDG